MKNGDKVKLKTLMAGPRGNHGVGCILTVGKELEKESADHLIKTNQAEKVEAVSEKTKTVDAPKEKGDEKPKAVETPRKEEAQGKTPKPKHDRR